MSDAATKEEFLARLEAGQDRRWLQGGGDGPQCYRCGNADGLFHTADGPLCTGCCIDYAEKWRARVRRVAADLATEIWPDD